MRWAAVVAVAGLALLGACGRGGGGSSTSTSSPSTTLGTTSTLAVTSTTVPPQTAASRPTPTEPASASLADGTYPVYLAGVNVAARTITVDVVQVLDRHSAEAATVCPEIASGGIDGYCIKNASARLRTLPVIPTPTLRVLTGADLHDVGLPGLSAARHGPNEANFYEINLVGGKVTAAKELYRA